jgi:AcrR family transcriptional regulator
MSLLSVNTGTVGYAHGMTGPAPTLTELKRRAVIDHILATTRRLVLTSGLDVTMDQLAEAAGLSRRTLFRLFNNREALLATAFEAGLAGYREGLPAYAGDRDSWLRATCEAAHRGNSTIGPGFFELASRTDLSRDLAVIEERRRREFSEAMNQIADTAWSSSGGKGKAPRDLACTVAAHLSPFFTAATMIDAGLDWQAAADRAYDSILAAILAAIESR